MIFLNPCNDVAFKRIFGSEQHKEITISFLNSMLELTEEKSIVSIDFLNTEQLPQISEKKENILDVLCVDQAGNKYIVEMQVAPVREFGKRMVYYGAKTYSTQLGKGKPYTELKPVIVLAIINFVMFPEKKAYKSIHEIRDRKTSEYDIKELVFAFVELPKFNKKEHELVTPEDKWLYFIKEIKKQNQVPDLLKEGEFGQACHIAERMTWSEQELNWYDDAFVRATDIQSGLELAEERGEKRGISKGIVEGEKRGISKGIVEGEKRGISKGIVEGEKRGRSKGIVEGEKKGEKKGKLEVAKQLLLSGFSKDDIMRLTGLLSEEIDELKKKN